MIAPIFSIVRLIMSRYNAGAGVGPDRWLVWPALLTILITVIALCGYGGDIGLVYLAGIVLALIGAVFGVAQLLRRRVRKALAISLPAIFFLVLVSPAGAALRMTIGDSANQARFYMHQQAYAEEARQLQGKGLHFKAWRLGIQDATEIYLLYDDADDALAGFNRKFNQQGFCKARTVQLEHHFQIGTVVC